MGMFDQVNFEMPCPKCGETLRDFQTKDAECALDTIEPDGVANFYSGCKCGQWVEFSRRMPRRALREKPLTREQVEAMGFVMVSPAPHQKEQA